MNTALKIRPRSTPFALVLLLLVLLGAFGLTHSVKAESNIYTSTGNHDYGALLVDNENLTVATGWECEHDYIGIYSQDRWTINYDEWEGTYWGTMFVQAPYGTTLVEYLEMPNPLIGDEMTFDLTQFPSDPYAYLIWYDCIDTDGIYHRSQFSFKPSELLATTTPPMQIYNDPLSNLLIVLTIFMSSVVMFYWIISRFRK